MAINRVLIGHLNINTIRSKFDVLSSMAKDNIDISLIVSEKKLGSYFPSAQFVIEGYAPSCRYNRNCHDGIAMIDVKSTTCKSDIKRFFVGLNFRKKIFVLFL